MKKYWIGESYVKTTLGIVAGCVIADLLFSLSRELAWLDLWTVCAVTLGGVTAALWLVRPVGIWKVFWVQDGVLYEEHVLTHRIRSMALDAQHAIRRRETLRTTWLVVAEKDVPLTTVKQAKALYRQGKAMMVPIEGSLKEALAAVAEKAPYLD